MNHNEIRAVEAKFKAFDQHKSNGSTYSDVPKIMIKEEELFYYVQIEHSESNHIEILPKSTNTTVKVLSDGLKYHRDFQVDKATIKKPKIQEKKSKKERVKTDKENSFLYTIYECLARCSGNGQDLYFV